jgi:hypothetical protein
MHQRLPSGCYTGAMGRELHTCAFAALACLAPAGAEAHDWYSGLQDKHGVSCCNGEDWALSHFW